MIRGIVFDMDGVLLDSEPTMYKASILGLQQYGISPIEDDFRPYVGTGEASFLGNVARKYGLEYRDDMKDVVYGIYCRIVDAEIRRFEQVPETLLALRQKGYLLAVASGADWVKVNANLRAAHIPEDAFACVITGDQVIHNKPDPEIFLKAAAGMGLPPEQCVVIEDALSGIRGAAAAGMQSIGVTSTFSEKALREAGASQLVSQMKELAEVLPPCQALS